jgi:tyrosinase
VVAGVGIAGFALAGCTEQQLADLLNQIANRPVRRDISTLDTNDPIIQSYEAAIVAMKALPQSDPRNWTRQAQIHNTKCRHHDWLFFPWHRAYLYYFERICRQVSGDDSFALPYWNWTTNPKIPAVFWDQTSALYHTPRAATQSSTANSLAVGQPLIDDYLDEDNFLIFGGPAVPLNDQSLFGPFNGPLEGGPHNYIHDPFVGGTMASFMSPLDPIFWTHHNRMEQLWVTWNITMGNPNTNNSDWTQTTFNEFVDRDGSAVQVSVQEGLLYPLLSYRFDTQTP